MFASAAEAGTRLTSGSLPTAMTAPPPDAVLGRRRVDGAPLAHSRFVAELKPPYSTEPRDDQEPPRRALQIPFATIGKILFVAFLVWAIVKLATIITMMLVAIVLAIAFEPLVELLQRLRLPRWAASVLVVLTVVATVVFFLIVSGASLGAQARVVGQRLISIEKDLVQRLPPYLGRIVTRDSATTTNASDVAGYAVTIGSAIVNALLVTVIASILTLYLLIDGRRTVGVGRGLRAGTQPGAGPGHGRGGPARSAEIRNR